jgi:transcriptional regulator with AAA-type ATPase domain
VNGFVPVDAGLDDPAMWHAIGDRSILLIDRQFEGPATGQAPSDRQDDRVSEHRPGGRGWRRLLDAVSRRGRGHLLLLVTSGPVARVPSLRLEPAPIHVLAEAVRPFAWLAGHRAVVETAARRACGHPGRFAAALWQAPRLARTASMAAERAPDYGEAGPEGPRRLSRRAWPVSGDVATLRHKLSATAQLLEGGRHAAAIRELRSLVLALARRHDWSTAAHGAATLSCALLSRGQTADLPRVLDEAGGWAERAQDEVALGALSLVRAAWHVHHGALGEAEAVARGVLSAAAARDDMAQHVAAVAALARSLFWQARFAEAGDVVARVDVDRCGPREAVALAVAAARAAVGWSVTGGGHTLASNALAAAERVGEATWLARAHGVMAFTHAAAGDGPATQRAVGQAVAHARAAHDQHLALHARLIGVEVDRREGRTASASRLLAHLARLPRGAVSATVGARIALLRELLDGVPADLAADRLSATTGFRALPLFAPRRTTVTFTEPQLADVLDLVARMQAGEDDRAALVAVCAGLRQHLRAAAVGFVVEQGTTHRCAASDGVRIETDIACRALRAGQLVIAHPDAGGVEAATPVRHGGRTVGALVARWSAGITPRSERTAAFLTLGSALAGPALLAAGRGHVPGLPDEIAGVSDGIQAVRSAIERAAPVSYPVLIEGESGSGKELVARALHRRSPRRDRPFVAVNCAAIPDDLLEAELFGHAKGAFTGAMIERPGVFEEAHGGTIFLDEVGELSPRAQAKLLRTLQEGEVRRVGENLSRRVDARVVAATNRNLRAEVAAGRFRLDLLYRLDVVRVAVPPLRERTTDLTCLIERFWHEATERVHSRAVLSAPTLAALAQYHWPGNVRELQNVMAALAVRAPKRGVVPPSALPWVGGGSAPDPSAAVSRLDVARQAFEVQFVRSALVRAGGHRGRAATALGLSRQGLTKLMSRLAIADERSGNGEV